MDSNTYTPLQEDNSLNIKKGADNLLSILFKNNFLTKKQYSNLTNINFKCPIFYGVPKIHKEGCPLRPIVSQTLGPTKSLHQLLDSYLQYAESQIPNLLKDTTSFLQLILNKQNNINSNSLLVTLDVVSLYTNIPQEEGIDFVVEYYSENLVNQQLQNNSVKPISPSLLKTLLQYVLNNTIFTFNNKFYSQKFGCSMGAQSSVKYANIYMYKFFLKFFQQYNGEAPDFLARLVDDVFTIWNGALSSLLSLVEQLNKYHSTIKFELKYSNVTIQFLDTVVYIKNNSLQTTLYTKPTDRKQYLQYSSSHPSHLKKSIPFSQALRYRRIISEPHNLHTQLKNLKLKFKNRNYPPSIINPQINKVLTIPRENTLVYKSKTNNTTFTNNFLPLIITYHPTLFINKNHNIHKIVTNSWSQFLTQNPNFHTIFNNVTPKIVYKKHKTINSYITSSTYPPSWARSSSVSEEDTVNILQSLLIHNNSTTQNNLINKCQHKKCLCCNFISNMSYLPIFQSCPLPISQPLSCNSNNIIYLIHCTKCRKNYIGQTKRPLKDRLTNHRSNIKTKKLTPISIHFNLPQHTLNNLKIMPIHQFPNTYSTTNILKLEKFYINTYKTYYPWGINYYPIINS